MKDKSGKMQILIWVLAAVPVLLVLAVYGNLPEKIPTNWGFNGQVTYGDKSNIWMIAGMAPLFGLTFYFLPKVDPKKRSYQKFMGSYQLFQVVFQLFLIVMTGIIVTESFRPGTVNVAAVVCALCGLLFLIMGNMMPKFRQNFFCGIKTPWTLSSEVVWTKTHRLGGRLFFASGLIAFLGAFHPNDIWKMAAVFGPLMVSTVITGVMSYIWFRTGAGEE